MRAYTDAFARHGRTVGQVLLTVDDVTRRAHYRNAYRTLRRLLDLRRGADRQRERHGRHRGDPLRRQRPARRAGRRAGPRRPAGPAVRRGRPLHRRPEPSRLARDRPRYAPTRTSPASPSAVRQGRRRHRRHGHQGRGGPDRHRRRHPGRAHLGRAGRPGARRRGRRHALPPAAGNARPPGCSGSRTPPRRAAGCTSTRARSRRWSAGARRCCRPASPRWTGEFAAGDPVDLVDTGGTPVARGLVNYDAAELPGLLGRSTVRPRRRAGPTATNVRSSTATTSSCC